MKCATNAFAVLAFFAAITLLVTSSDAGCISTNGRVTSTLHGMTNAAAGMLNRLGGGYLAPYIKVVSDPSERPWITEANMKNWCKWKAAVYSEDPTMLNRMLKLCRGCEAQYADRMHGACLMASRGKRWDSYTKIIEAMCMDLDRFRQDIFDQIARAIHPLNAPYLAAVLDGIAGRMDQVLPDIITVLAKIVVFGPKASPRSAEKICEYITHAGLKELSTVAMIENKHERLTELLACLKHRNDWPQGLIEHIAQVILGKGEYYILKALLEMEPTNKYHLRKQALDGLANSILALNSNKVNGLIQTFEIPTVKVHYALDVAVGICLYYGSIKKVKRIIEFLNSNPRQYKSVVDAVLKECRREDLTKYDLVIQECHQMFQDWITKEEARQKEEDGEWQDLHFNVHHPMT